MELGEIINFWLTQYLSGEKKDNTRKSWASFVPLEERNGHGLYVQMQYQINNFLKMVIERVIYAPATEIPWIPWPRCQGCLLTLRIFPGSEPILNQSLHYGLLHTLLSLNQFNTKTIRSTMTNSAKKLCWVSFQCHQNRLVLFFLFASHPVSLHSMHFLLANRN